MCGSGCGPGRCIRKAARGSSTSEHENKALIRKAFDDWAAGTGGVFGLLAPDAPSAGPPQVHEPMQRCVVIDHVKGVRIPQPKPEVLEAIVRLMEEARRRADDLLQRAQDLRGESANVVASARQQMMDTLRK